MLAVDVPVASRRILGEFVAAGERIKGARALSSFESSWIVPQQQGRGRQGCYEAGVEPRLVSYSRAARLVAPMRGFGRVGFPEGFVVESTSSG